VGIERTVHADGSWTETAKDPKSAVELFEKHKDGMQKDGAEKFHKSYMNDLSTGFERVRDQSGKVTHIRADEVSQSLANGYKPMNQPRTVVPALPWPRKKQAPGKHRYRYNKTTGEMEEC
jgi:hypothetical protein